MMGFGLGGIGFVVMLLFWMAIVALAIWFVSSFFPDGRSTVGPSMSNHGSAARGSEPSALEVAQQRYAAGEIGREEFQEIARTLSGSADTHNPDSAIREASW